MDFIHRPSFFRAYDLSLGANRLILLLSLLGGVAGAAVTLSAGRPMAEVLGQALRAAITVFGAATLAKELDPDTLRSAVLAAVVALPAVWVIQQSSLALLVWLLLHLRFLNRSSGLAPTPVDMLALLIVTAWVGWVISPMLIVLTGGAVLLDGLLPAGRRAHRPLGVVVALAGLGWLALGPGPGAPVALSPAADVAVLAAAAAFIGVILTSYSVAAVGDTTGQPLNPARVQAGQAVALSAALLLASWQGANGLALGVALWAAVLGAVIGRVTLFNTRRSTAAL